MKFYVPCHKIDMLLDQTGNCSTSSLTENWLMEADFEPFKERIVLRQFANGWIYEADDSFNSFFTIITGYQLPIITDQEYAQYVLDKIAYLGSSRTNDINKAWAAFNSKPDK